MHRHSAELVQHLVEHFPIHSNQFHRSSTDIEQSARNIFTCIQMPPSMRKQTASINKRLQINEEKIKSRKKAIILPREGEIVSVREISRRTGCPIRMVSILNNVLQNKDEQKLAKLIDPYLITPERKLVVTREEEDMIVKHMVRAGNRGFVVMPSDLKAN